MHSPSPLPDPVELGELQLDTDHSPAMARSALRTIACALGVDVIDWASLTYANFARIRAEPRRLSVAWGNACLSVLRRCAVEGRGVGVLDVALVDDVLSFPRLCRTSGRLGRDIDVINRVVTVRAGKGIKTRQVPLPIAAAGILGEWIDKHPGNGQLLRSVDRWGNIGKRLTSDSVAFILERLCDQAGVERASANAFRVHRITQVIADPMSNLSIAAKLAGHSCTSVTTRYSRRGLEALQSIIEDVDVPARPPLQVVA